MSENNLTPKKRGRPAGAQNVKKSFSLLAKNEALARSETKRIINLFVIKKLQQVEDIFDAQSPTGKAKLLIELLKYATPTASKDVEVLNKGKDKKPITNITISYDKTKQNTIDVEAIVVDDNVENNYLSEEEE